MHASTQNGPFGQFAFHLCDLGRAPVPTGGDDGKKPRLKGYSKRQIVNLGNVRQLQLEFGAANVALVCGLSDLIVVDVDDPALLPQMVKRFGGSSIIVRTGGRGGFQIYFRAVRDVGPIDLRHSEGIAVEIKAQGNIVVAPPSVNLRTGRPYQFVEGDWSHDALVNLPVFRAEAVFAGMKREARAKAQSGARNNWLFSTCLGGARHVDTLDELVDYARTRNEELSEPLPVVEAERCAQSAWRYQVEGGNFVGSEASVVLGKSEINELARLFPGEATALYLKLRAEHGARIDRGETFALVTDAMVAAGSLPGWTRWNLRTAIDEAIQAGVLNKAWSGRGRPAQYTLAPPVPKVP